MRTGKIHALCAAVLLVSAAPEALFAKDVPPSEEQAEAQWQAKMKALEQGLHPQSGRIAIAPANATLELGKDYYFLPADEAKRVLTEAWGNPPSAVSGVLGLVLPAGKKFNDNTWGAVIQYEDTGHINDGDAASQDYDSVLADMKSAEEENNKLAVKEGYPASHVVGWARSPAYDSSRKTLIWARDISFDGSTDHTLNYDVRTLGRSGLLSLNMVDIMPNLPSVQRAAIGLGSTVHFNAGARYADFDASKDKVADYGLAGVVAAGAGLAVAQKVGIFGVIALFFKKAIALIIAAALGGGAWLRRKLGRGYKEAAFDEDSEQVPEPERGAGTEDA